MQFSWLQQKRRKENHQQVIDPWWPHAPIQGHNGEWREMHLLISDEWGKSRHVLSWLSLALSHSPLNSLQSKTQVKVSHLTLTDSWNYRQRKLPEVKNCSPPPNTSQKGILISSQPFNSHSSPFKKNHNTLFLTLAVILVHVIRFHTLHT